MEAKNLDFRFSDIRFETHKDISLPEIEKLYTDVAWSNYTQDIDTLYRGIQNSLDVISAWHQDILVGLIRTIGDEATIIYIQDILILNAYQRRGIGRYLMQLILDKYLSVRQIVLLTDNTPKTNAFYVSLGMKSYQNSDLICYGK